MMNVKAGIVAAVLAVVLAAPVWADYDSAMRAYERWDYAAALAEFRTLAEQGDRDAQFMLGRMYAQGQGVIQDYVPAYTWFNLAASRGKREAFQERDTIARQMTPTQIAEAQRLSREWTPQAPAAPAPADTPEPASREIVTDIQRLLAALGYDPGPADGVMGYKTHLAIRSYQQDSGLPVDGEPSRELGEHLVAAYEARGAAQSSGPPAPAAGPRPEQDRLKAFADRLLGLITQAESRRAADPGFLAELRELAQRLDSPWPTKIFRDDFRDGDYHRDPAWRVVAGRFLVDYTAGLTSEVKVAPAAPARSGSSKQDLAGAIFQTVLQHATKTGGETAGGEEERAEIYLAATIPNAFDIQVALTSRETRGGLEFGPYAGGERNRGYRLAYRPGARRNLELLRLSGYGTAVVERYDGSVRLEDGRSHTVRWTRLPSGDMVVTLDGTEILRSNDRGMSEAFDGFTFVNTGGEYSVREVSAYGAE